MASLASALVDVLAFISALAALFNVRAGTTADFFFPELDFWTFARLMLATEMPWLLLRIPFAISLRLLLFSTFKGNPISSVFSLRQQFSRKPHVVLFGSNDY